ncbi:MAG: glycosyltransferase [Bacteroidetes bacterium]|nr:glycosyltransferase [Bacteroidota bacterium]
MDNKQILYLSYDGMTDPLGQSQVLPYIIGLSKHGYSFTLISCEKKERYFQYKATILEICKNHQIDWQPVFYTKKPPILSTIWDIFQMNKKSKILHQKKNFQLIHCRSYISSLIGLGFKKKYGTKFIFDMRGFWADERVDGNIWNLKNPFYKIIYNFFKKKERLFLTYADSIVSLTQSGKNEMLAWNIEGLSEEKIVVIPCAADYKLFELKTDETQKEAKKLLGINQQDFVLSYIGSIGTWYLLDEMVLFFSLLKKQKTTAKFLFLTPDSEDFILETAKKYNLTKEDFIIQFAQRKDIPKIAHASDYSIFFIKPSYSKKSSSPTKMGELLAMGIPIICNNNVGDVEEITIKTKAGFCIDTFNETKFVEVTNKLNNWKESSPETRREFSKQFYDLANGVKLYLAVYNQLF